MAAGLTDLFGDVPYYTAFNGTEEVTPAYDSQESIYMNEILDNLDKGIAAIQSYVLSITEEIYCITVIYNGFDLQSIKI
jgi:hypothetical protein